MRRVRFLALFVLAVSARAVAAPPSPAGSAAPAKSAASAPVVVTLVVDQLAAWVADARWPLLPADGGFARLIREGTWAHAIVYPYAVTDTAPGHATLFTGAPPKVSGIYGNDRFDDVTGKKVALVKDPATHLVTSDGPRDLPSSSLAALRVPALADSLRAGRRDATIIALSLKDRAALPGGGRHPSASVWLDTSVGRFVTSSALASSFPAWALPVVGPDFLRAARSFVWQPLDVAFVRAHAATADDQPGEGDYGGLGTRFPHRLADAEDPALALRATPAADELLFALGRAALAQRRPGQPMLLAISLSANDYVGHVFGPDSWEAWDELERLDAALGRFLSALDDAFGRDGWSLLLSADHGTTTLPEAANAARPWCRPGAPPDPFERPCTAPGRILQPELADELRAVAKRTLGDGDAAGWVAGVADPYVFFTPAARALDGERRAQLEEALIDHLEAHEGVAAVTRTRASRCGSGDPLPSLVCRSLPSGVPAGLYVSLRPGWFFDAELVAGRGVSHGSGYRYDRTVPLLVRAPGRVPAGASLTTPLDPAVYARTAAHLLGVAPPPAARQGRDLVIR